MDFKFIAKYSVLLYLSLMLSGVPIGYFVDDIDSSGGTFPSQVIFYKYAAIFFISVLCFYFLAKSSKSRPFFHGLIVVFLVSAFSLFVDVALLTEIDLLLWFIDVGLVFVSLFIGIRAYALHRHSRKHV